VPSINLDIDYFDHLKTVRLIGLLGKGSEVLPIRLWCRVAKFHGETGELAGYSAQEIESLVGWCGKPGEMIGTMVKTGFLEQTENGYRIPGWKDKQGHIAAYHERGRKAAVARWAKLKGDATSNASSIPKQSPYIAVLTNKTNITANAGKTDSKPPYADSNAASLKKGAARIGRGK